MWESDEGRTVSYWQATENGWSSEPLKDSIETDVCVIGGGIAGLTAAYLLGRSGKRVVVIDDGPIGGGETARTTAHLTWAIDDRFYRIAKWHGDEKARRAGESHAAAVDTIERIVTEERNECDFSRGDGYIFEAAESDDELEMEAETTH